jgi:hypothetical protein
MYKAQILRFAAFPLRAFDEILVSVPLCFTHFWPLKVLVRDAEMPM